MQRLVHIDQGIQSGRHQLLRPPLRAVWHRHVDAAPLGRKDAVGQFRLLDVVVAGERPNAGEPFFARGPHDRCLFSHFFVNAEGVALGPCGRITKIEAIKHRVGGVEGGCLLS